MGNCYKDWFRQAEADLRHARNALADGDYEFGAHPPEVGETEKALISSLF